ncbi:MAG: hypothetical protein WD228_07740 [Mycobacterium sp.]
MPLVSDEDLDALLDQLPVLACQQRRVEDLPGGLTNRKVKIPATIAFGASARSAPR